MYLKKCSEPMSVEVLFVRVIFHTYIEHVNDIFSSPPRPDRSWGPPSLLSSGYRGLLRLAEGAGA